MSIRHMDQKNNIFDHLKPGKIQVPDDSYFEQLTKRVIEEEKKIVPIYRKPLFWVSSAAAAIALIVVFNALNSGNQQEDVLLALNDFSKDEIHQYIEEHLDEFDTELIMESIPTESLNADVSVEVIEEHKVKATEVNLSLDSIDKQDILDYFEDQEIDPYELTDDESFI